MKILFIAYNEAVDEEVMELLTTNSIEAYTKWTKVLGKGKSSGPHLLTHVWPKANNVLMVATDDDRAGAILKGVRELRKTLAHEGIKAFLLPLQEAT